MKDFIKKNGYLLGFCLFLSIVLIVLTKIFSTSVFIGLFLVFCLFFGLSIALICYAILYKLGGYVYVKFFKGKLSNIRRLKKEIEEE